MRNVILCALAFALLVAGTVLVFPVHVLEVKSAHTGQRVLFQKVKPGDTFVLSFVHSVEKSTVRDNFRVDDTYRIVLYETEFTSLNAGLPAVKAFGETLIWEDGRYRMRGMHRVFHDLHVWVDEHSHNTLEIGGHLVDLSHFSTHSLLKIQVLKTCFGELLFISMIDHVTLRSV